MTTVRTVLAATVATVAVGAVAACDGPAPPRPQLPPSSPPAVAGRPPATGPPACADLGESTVRGTEIPYNSTVEFRRGRWYARDGHIFLVVEPVCAIGALSAGSAPVAVGSVSRQASGYTYAYWDIIVCFTVTACTVGVSLANHEEVVSITIADQVVTIDSLAHPHPRVPGPTTERSTRYTWDGTRLRDIRA